MTVNRTTLLDLPLPVTGTESGTWGDTTNNGLTQYIDIAVAGMTSLTSSDFTAGALSLSNSTGDSSATNIAASSAQYGAIKVSSLAQASTITAPSSNRRYVIINADATYNLIIKASGQTGVTVVPGEKALVAFNGTDYVKVGGAAGGSTTQVQYNNAGVLAGSANFTFDGSNVGIGVTPTASSNTGILQNQGGILFAFSNTFQDLSQNAYYNGGYKYTNSNFATLYRQNGGTHQWFNSASGTAGNAITFTQAMTLDASGNLGIGTTAPSYRVHSRSGNGNVALTNSGNYPAIFGFDNNGNAEYFILHGYELRIQTGGSTLGTGTERMRITSGGNLLVGTTTNNASGGVIQVSNGITFPATQSASTDANTLDDYEEGSYTPTDSSGASLSFTSAYGYYTKVGRLVTYNFAVTYPSTASGSIARISLPFTQSSGMDPNASTGGFMFYVNTATTSTIMPIIGSGSNSLGMYFQSNMFDVTNANLSGKILRGMVIFYV